MLVGWQPVEQSTCHTRMYAISGNKQTQQHGLLSKLEAKHKVEHAHPHRRDSAALPILDTTQVTLQPNDRYSTPPCKCSSSEVRNMQRIKALASAHSATQFRTRQKFRFCSSLSQHSQTPTTYIPSAASIHTLTSCSMYRSKAAQHHRDRSTAAYTTAAERLQEQHKLLVHPAAALLLPKHQQLPGMQLPAASCSRRRCIG
jgi:hypothetical protein